MQVEDDIKKRIWEGYIPVVFNLPSHEITSLTAPHPFYVMVSRQNYLTNYIQDIRDHFESFVTSFDKQNDSIWFEYKDIPLKW